MLLNLMHFSVCDGEKIRYVVPLAYGCAEFTVPEDLTSEDWRVIRLELERLRDSRPKKGGGER